MLRCTGYAVIIVYGLSVLGATIASHHADQPSSTPPQANTVPSPNPSMTQPLRGFAISLHHTDQLDRYLHAIDEIAALGANSVEVATPAFQTNGASQQIRIETGPGRGPGREQLIELLRHAKSQGLQTALMPQVLFTDPRGNEWRGKIHPDKWDPWWRSYQNMIDYFLDIAIEADVDLFSVGSELISTERQIDRWAALIAHVRSRYDGLLTYSTNWDHYPVPTIWQHLDMIGVSGYWDLTIDAQHDPPTHEELAGRWGDIRDKLLAFAATQDRPVLFTEVGYPSLPWALKDPWNYVNSDDLPADPHAQHLGYAAFLSAWQNLLVERPNPHVMAGVFFYEWDPYHRGGPQDSGYGVQGKPVFDLLKQWFNPTRTAAATPPHPARR